MRLIENDTVTETSHYVQKGAQTTQAVTIADIWEAHKLLKQLQERAVIAGPP